MRIVTEDAELVLWSVAGAQLLAAEKEDLAELIEHCTVFAKVTPQQKMSIVTGLQSKGHIVGFLGDGNNDAPALRKADVGVSVDSVSFIYMPAHSFQFCPDCSVGCSSLSPLFITWNMYEVVLAVHSL